MNAYVRYSSAIVELTVYRYTWQESGTVARPVRWVSVFRDGILWLVSHDEYARLGGADAESLNIGMSFGL